MINITHKSLGFNQNNTDIYVVNAFISENYSESYISLLSTYAYTILQSAAYNVFQETLPTDEDALHLVSKEIDRSNPRDYVENAYEILFNINIENIHLESFDLLSITRNIGMHLLTVNALISVNIYLKNIEVRNLIINTEDLIITSDINIIKISDSKVDFMYILSTFNRICLDDTSTIMLSELLLDYMSDFEEPVKCKLSGPKIIVDTGMTLTNNILKSALRYNDKDKQMKYITSMLVEYGRSVYTNAGHVVVSGAYRDCIQYNLLELENGSQVQYIYYLTNMVALLYEEISNKYYMKPQSTENFIAAVQNRSVGFLSDMVDLNLRYYRINYPNIRYPYSYRSPELKDIVKQMKEEMEPIELSIIKESVDEFV